MISNVSQLPDTGRPQSEQEYWQREWERKRSDNAVVDVDVRGWVYLPHRGAHTRRQRLAIGALRQFAGIPAPPATKQSDSLQPSQNTSRVASPERLTKQEEDLIQFETEKMERRGERERRNAQQGVYSEDPSKIGDGDGDSIYESRNSSPDRGRRNRLSTISSQSSQDGPSSPIITPLQKRSSWSQPARMSAAELAVANAHLMHRVKPFMHNGLENSAIQLFFFNDADSRQLTVYTDQSGHFTCRASLDFVPTHVRVLATDKLSTTEEIMITSPKGVSLISDIDDTVKHSAISAGVSEVVRNAFIRDLGDLTIEGVREWYTTLHSMGVKMHYVSNSPWQMYPILTSYFKMARLPPGSFHLKQYSGILNGIFEPVAERKKSSLDKLFRDFPDRKFILVGDSGEADLEVYTDTASENPGRVLGIFIRDVTTPNQTGYFDSSMKGPPSGGHSRHHSRNRSGDTLAMSKRLSRPEDIRDDDADLKAAIAASLADMEEEARHARRSINPDLPTPVSFDGTRDRISKPAAPPPRRQGQRVDPGARMTASPDEEDLIDLNEPAPSKPWLEPRHQTTLPVPSNGATKGQKPMPSPPPKPQSLRSLSPGPQSPPAADNTSYRAPPPRPRKPSSAVKPPSPLPVQVDGPARASSASPPILPSHAHPASAQNPAATNSAAQLQVQTHQPSPLSQVTRQESPASAKVPPPLPSRPGALQKLANAAGSYWHGQPSADQSRPSATTGNYPDAVRSMSTSSTKSMDELRTNETTPKANAPPPLPARRNMNSYQINLSSKRSSSRLSGGLDGDGSSLPSSPSEAGMSKKEYMWVTRLARARARLEPAGVTLRTWRVGQDVADICVKLAEMELRRIEKEQRSQ